MNLVKKMQRYPGATLADIGLVLTVVGGIGCVYTLVPSTQWPIKLLVTGIGLAALGALYAAVTDEV